MAVISQPRRILFVSYGFPPRIGGVSHLLGALAADLYQRGFQLAAVTEVQPGAPSQERMAGCRVHRFPFAATIARRNVSAVADLRHTVHALVDDFAADLIHLHTPRSALAFFIVDAPALDRVPMLVTAHTVWSREGWEAGTIGGRVLRRANWATGVTGAALRRMCELAPHLSGRSSLIHNAVTLPAEEPEEPPFAPPRILCLGRLEPIKGIDVALRAFARLRHTHAQARLVIAGDGSARPDLEALARDLRIPDAVDFVGWIAPEKVFDVIRRASLLVMPSHTEGLPLAGLQAAGLGRPIVASRTGGLIDLVEHGVTGWLVPPGDDVALADAMSTLLADPKAARNMGHRGRRRVLNSFSWERCVSSYAGLYARLIEREEEC